MGYRSLKTRSVMSRLISPWIAALSVAWSVTGCIPRNANLENRRTNQDGSGSNGCKSAMSLAANDTCMTPQYMKLCIESGFEMSADGNYCVSGQYCGTNSPVSYKDLTGGVTFETLCHSGNLLAKLCTEKGFVYSQDQCFAQDECDEQVLLGEQQLKDNTYTQALECPTKELKEKCIKSGFRFSDHQCFLDGGCNPVSLTRDDIDAPPAPQACIVPISSKCVSQGYIFQNETCLVPCNDEQVVASEEMVSQLKKEDICAKNLADKSKFLGLLKVLQGRLLDAEQARKNFDSDRLPLGAKPLTAQIYDDHAKGLASKFAGLKSLVDQSKASWKDCADEYTSAFGNRIIKEKADLDLSKGRLDSLIDFINAETPRYEKSQRFIDLNSEFDALNKKITELLTAAESHMKDDTLIDILYEGYNRCAKFLDDFKDIRSSIKDSYFDANERRQIEEAILAGSDSSLDNFRQMLKGAGMVLDPYLGNATKVVSTNKYICTVGFDTPFRTRNGQLECLATADKSRCITPGDSVKANSCNDLIRLAFENETDHLYDTKKTYANAPSLACNSEDYKTMGHWCNNLRFRQQSHYIYLKNSSGKKKTYEFIYTMANKSSYRKADSNVFLNPGEDAVFLAAFMMESGSNARYLVSKTEGEATESGCGLNNVFLVSYSGRMEIEDTGMNNDTCVIKSIKEGLDINSSKANVTSNPSNIKFTNSFGEKARVGVVLQPLASDPGTVDVAIPYFLSPDESISIAKSQLQILNTLSKYLVGVYVETGLSGKVLCRNFARIDLGVSQGTSFTISIGRAGDCVVKKYTPLKEIVYPNGLKDITVGGNHACALDAKGVLCWGSNRFKQLEVPALSHPRKISAGGGFTCAIDDAGVKCWGQGFTDDVRFTVPQLNNPIMIEAGSSHACALEDSGKVKCWGYNAIKQATPPTDLESANYISLGATGTTSCALTLDRLRCWGMTPVNVQLDGPISVGVHTWNVCALDRKGVTCFGSRALSYKSGFSNPTSVSINGDYYGSIACVVDGGVSKCWSAWDSVVKGGQDNGLTGLVSYSNEGEENGCAVNASGVHCWGETEVQNVPPRFRY